MRSVRIWPRSVEGGGGVGGYKERVCAYENECE